MTSQLLSDRDASLMVTNGFVCLFSFFSLEVLLPFGERFNIYLHDDVGIQSLSPVCPGCFSFSAGQLCPGTDREGIRILQPTDSWELKYSLRGACHKYCSGGLKGTD